MHSTVTTVGTTTVITLEGSIDLAAVGTLYGDLTRLIRDHPGAILVVDLDAVDVLDDAGLGVLLGAAANARESGGDLDVVCTRASICDRLRRTRFDVAINVRSTIA